MVSDLVRKQYDSRFAYVWAFIVLFFLSMLIGVSIIVGSTSLSPRTAALVMILPAMLGTAIGVRFWIVRRIFSAFLFFG